MSPLVRQQKVALEPGQQLKHARERLQLKYRDVQEASRHIAFRHRNTEFLVGLSRLADIENRGTVPSIYRLYSLCAIYGLEWSAVLGWYGISVASSLADRARATHSHSGLLQFASASEEEVELPELSAAADLRVTSYISREIVRWGKLPITLIKSLDLQRQKYAFLGTDDWSMYPILIPGSFLQIDDSRTKIAQDSWDHEIERPIYFLEHRNGFRCGWCSQTRGSLILQPHWSFGGFPETFKYPGEIDVVGQVVGVAMRLGLVKRRRTHFLAGPK